MTEVPTPCKHCGHHFAPPSCPHCRGQTRSLCDRDVVMPGRGIAVADFARGVRDVYRAVFALLHEREFLGLLRLPVWANTFVFALLILAGFFVLQPWYANAFARPWWLFDGLRRDHAGHGAALWLAATWLVLGMPLLEAFAGALGEPLHIATERAMLGHSAVGTGQRGAFARLRDRARLCLIALLTVPIALFLVLLPWIGLPIVALLGAGIAAAVWFELPMARRGLDLRARLELVWRNRWRALGVGCALQIAAAVPPLNLVGLSGVATVAASSAYLAFEKGSGPRRARSPSAG